MPLTPAYSLVPTSPSSINDEDNFEGSWPTNTPRYGRHRLASLVANQRARFARRPHTVTVAAISTLCILALLTVVYDHSISLDLPPEREPTVRDCFELPADELVWQTTQLPSEHSQLCPFDPEPFAILRDPLPSPKVEQNAAEWSNECLEAMLADGQVHPRSCDQKSPQQNINLVWTWVNGSSTLLELTRHDRIAQVSGPPQPDMEADDAVAGLAAKLFRDHDELRHSVRAALRHFNAASGAAAKFFIVGSDLPVSVQGSTEDEPTTTGARVGQLPAWLDLDEMGVDGSFTSWSKDGKQTQLHIRHHRDIFSHYDGTVFNSLAIESQFSNLDRIGVSDIFVYINDDVFFSRDLSPRDFHMGEQGIVMRMQNYITISPDPDVPQHDGLEWESLQYSNLLLSDRFGRRFRPYPAHLAKTLSIPMLKEVSETWAEQATLVSRHPFRGMRHMEGQQPGLPADMYMVFMEHHWIVERWREALLWSWVVARGEYRAKSQGESGPDVWSKPVAQQAWRELGGRLDVDNMQVRRAPRKTLEKSDEWAGAKATTVVFSSLDGYPYSEDMGEQGWVSEGDVCGLNFEHCFSVHDSASRAFQRIAFEEPTTCGDCIIHALINQSGERGLEAFLPPKSEKSYSTSQQAPPRLPLSPRWQETDFSLSSVLPEQGNVRQFVLHMLQRYRFILGETPFMFSIVTDPQSAIQNVEAITSDPTLAILCVNDDVAEDDDGVRGILETWMDGRWNQSAGWERS